jgi:hypothetical protein
MATTTTTHEILVEEIHDYMVRLYTEALQPPTIEGEAAHRTTVMRTLETLANCVLLQPCQHAFEAQRRVKAQSNG